MQYRLLGRTGLSVSVIALGCEGFIGKSTKQVKEELDFARSKGINFIDAYSSNPEFRTNLGKALAGFREEWILQGHLCATWEEGQYLRTRDLEKCKSAFADQLKRLGTSYLDIGMLHYIDSEADLKEVFEGPVLAWALQLKKEGKIHHLGLSSHNPVVAQKAVESQQIDVLLFAINPCYDLQPAHEDVEELWADKNYEHALQNIDPEREKLYELCEREGVGIDVMKVYGGSDLLSAERSPFGLALTPVQCIEYALSRPAVAAIMVGARSISEMEAALAWCTASAQERDYATPISGLQKFTWAGHCMYCGHCAPCRVGIDIASVNKYLNLALSQKEIPETVRDHYHLLAHHASECIGCAQCQRNCPFGVAIVEQMKQAAEKFGY